MRLPTLQESPESAHGIKSEEALRLDCVDTIFTEEEKASGIFKETCDYTHELFSHLYPLYAQQEKQLLKDGDIRQIIHYCKYLAYAYHGEYRKFGNKPPAFSHLVEATIFHISLYTTIKQLDTVFLDSANPEQEKILDRCGCTKKKTSLKELIVQCRGVKAMDALASFVTRFEKNPYVAIVSTLFHDYPEDLLGLDIVAETLRLIEPDTFGKSNKRLPAEKAKTHVRSNKENTLIDSLKYDKITNVFKEVHIYLNENKVSTAMFPHLSDFLDRWTLHSEGIEQDRDRRVSFMSVSDKEYDILLNNVFVELSQFQLYCMLQHVGRGGYMKKPLLDLQQIIEEINLVTFRKSSGELIDPPWMVMARMIDTSVSGPKFGDVCSNMQTLGLDETINPITDTYPQGLYIAYKENVIQAIRDGEFYPTVQQLTKLKELGDDAFCETWSDFLPLVDALQKIKKYELYRHTFNTQAYGSLDLVLPFVFQEANKPLDPTGRLAKNIEILQALYQKNNTEFAAAKQEVNDEEPLPLTSLPQYLHAQAMRKLLKHASHIGDTVSVKSASEPPSFSTLTMMDTFSVDGFTPDSLQQLLSAIGGEKLFESSKETTTLTEKGIDFVLGTITRSLKTYLHKYCYAGTISPKVKKETEHRIDRNAETCTIHTRNDFRSFFTLPGKNSSCSPLTQQFVCDILKTALSKSFVENDTELHKEDVIFYTDVVKPLLQYYEPVNEDNKTLLKEKFEKIDALLQMSDTASHEKINVRLETIFSLIESMRFTLSESAKSMLQNVIVTDNHGELPRLQQRIVFGVSLRKKASEQQELKISSNPEYDTRSALHDVFGVRFTVHSPDAALHQLQELFYLIMEEEVGEGKGKVTIRDKGFLSPQAINRVKGDMGKTFLNMLTQTRSGHTSKSIPEYQGAIMVFEGSKSVWDKVEIQVVQTDNVNEKGESNRGYYRAKTILMNDLRLHGYITQARIRHVILCMIDEYQLLMLPAGGRDAVKAVNYRTEKLISDTKFMIPLYREGYTKPLYVSTERRTEFSFRRVLPTDPASRRIGGTDKKVQGAVYLQLQQKLKAFQNAVITVIDDKMLSASETGVLSVGSGIATQLWYALQNGEVGPQVVEQFFTTFHAQMMGYRSAIQVK